jgi:hypothetical protein
MHGGGLYNLNDHRPADVRLYWVGGCLLGSGFEPVLPSCNPAAVGGKVLHTHTPRPCRPPKRPTLLQPLMSRSAAGAITALGDRRELGWTSVGRATAMRKRPPRDPTKTPARSAG